MPLGECPVGLYKVRKWMWGRSYIASARSAMKKQGFFLYIENLAPNDKRWVFDGDRLFTSVLTVLMSLQSNFMGF